MRCSPVRLNEEVDSLIWRRNHVGGISQFDKIIRFFVMEWKNINIGGGQHYGKRRICINAIFLCGYF